MNKKGFTLIELLIGIFIIASSLLIPAIFKFMDDEKIAQKTGSLIKEFKQESTPEVKTETKIIDKSGVICTDGKKTIIINGKTYYLGTIKNTWGDLAPVECQ